MDSKFHDLPVMLPDELADYEKVSTPLIIPAYEPDERMPQLLKDLANYQDVILIVNDGSGTEYDHFYEEARDLGCIVLVHTVNQGKGRALKNAFAYCIENFPNMVGVITADSDGQHIPSDIEKIRQALIARPNDLILGCRDFSGADIPWKSTFGNNLTKNICHWVCGVKVSDTQTGLRGIPTKFMQQLLDVEGERFEFETRMLIATKDQFPIYEVKIETIYDSKENHQTHFDPIKDSIRIYRIFGEQFAKFIISSLSSCLIDLILFTICCKLLSGTPGYIAISTAIARVISAGYNFLINHKLVFKSKAGYGSSAIKYIILAILQMGCSALFVTLLCGLLTGIHATLIKLIVDTILFFISYKIQKKFVF